MRLLEVARPEDIECTITENFEIKFAEDRVFKVVGNQIVPYITGSENIIDYEKED